MFYSTQILAKKGPLGVVWIAAHMDRHLKRHQIYEASIPVTVDNIVNPEAPLALRLSGQLLLGVVRIYARKVGYLYQDCNQALIKIQVAFKSTHVVDLPADATIAPLEAITLPDFFDDMELLRAEAPGVITLRLGPLQLAAPLHSNSRSIQQDVSDLFRVPSSQYEEHEEQFEDADADLPFDLEDIEVERLRAASQAVARHAPGDLTDLLTPYNELGSSAVKSRRGDDSAVPSELAEESMDDMLASPEEMAAVPLPELEDMPDSPSAGPLAALPGTPRLSFGQEGETPGVGLQDLLPATPGGFHTFKDIGKAERSQGPSPSSQRLTPTGPGRIEAGRQVDLPGGAEAAAASASQSLTRQGSMDLLPSLEIGTPFGGKPVQLPGPASRPQSPERGQLPETAQSPLATGQAPAAPVPEPGQPGQSQGPGTGAGPCSAQPGPASPPAALQPSGTSRTANTRGQTTRRNLLAVRHPVVLDITDARLPATQLQSRDVRQLLMDRAPLLVARGAGSGDGLEGRGARCRRRLEPQPWTSAQPGWALAQGLAPSLALVPQVRELYCAACGELPAAAALARAAKGMEGAEEGAMRHTGAGQNRRVPVPGFPGEAPADVSPSTSGRVPQVDEQVLAGNNLGKAASPWGMSDIGRSPHGAAAPAGPDDMEWQEMDADIVNPEDAATAVLQEGAHAVQGRPSPDLAPSLEHAGSPNQFGSRTHVPGQGVSAGLLPNGADVEPLHLQPRSPGADKENQGAPSNWRGEQGTPLGGKLDSSVLHATSPGLNGKPSPGPAFSTDISVDINIPELPEAGDWLAGTWSTPLGGGRDISSDLGSAAAPDSSFTPRTHVVLDCLRGAAFASSPTPGPGGSHVAGGKRKRGAVTPVGAPGLAPTGADLGLGLGRTSGPGLNFGRMMRNRPRMDACRWFFELLVLRSQGYVELKQPAPYADIEVCPTAKMLA